MAKELLDTIVACTLFNEGTEEMGVGKMTLPESEFETTDYSGGGTAGSVTVPVLGAVKPMKFSIDWQSISPAQGRISAGTTRTLQARAAQQVLDPATGEITIGVVSAIMGIYVTKHTTGTLEGGKKGGASTECSVRTYKLTIDGETYIDIDVLNGKCIMGTKDYMSDVVKALRG
jgi:P2 family phage contractile tail tube protein